MSSSDSSDSGSWNSVPYSVMLLPASPDVGLYTVHFSPQTPQAGSTFKICCQELHTLSHAIVARIGKLANTSLRVPELRSAQLEDVAG